MVQRSQGFSEHSAAWPQLEMEQAGKHCLQTPVPVCSCHGGSSVLTAQQLYLCISVSLLPSHSQHYPSCRGLFLLILFFPFLLLVYFCHSLPEWGS